MNQNRLVEEQAKKKSRRAISNWEKFARGLLLKAKLENKYLKKPSDTNDENSGNYSLSTNLQDLAKHRVEL